MGKLFGNVSNLPRLAAASDFAPEKKNTKLRKKSSLDRKYS